MKKILILSLCFGLVACSGSFKSKIVDMATFGSSGCKPHGTKLVFHSTDTDLSRIEVYQSLKTSNFTKIKTISVSGGYLPSGKTEISFSDLSLSACDSNYVYSVAYDTSGNASTPTAQVCWGSKCP